MNEHELLRRAARAVVRSIDHEASCYEAHSPVEDWALDALQAALAGDLHSPARSLRTRRVGGTSRLRDLGVGRDMSGCCPRCKRPLTADGHLHYCDRCGYEPPESAALPVTPPRFKDADDSNQRPPSTTAAQAGSPRSQ